MRRINVLVVMFCFVFVSSAESRAQYGSEEGIQGNGHVTLERSAERMRMQVNLLAKSSKDLADALGKLKNQKAKAEKQLQTLGVIKESVKFGDPQVDVSQDDQQRQMQMMMRQRMSQLGKKKADKDQAVKIVKVSMKLTAEWPLKAADPVGLLLEATKLQDAIKAADMAGMKESEESTPEEAEIAEEMEPDQFAFSGYSSPQGPKPGEPEFAFVAKISDADRDKARADAFKAAKADASQLAKAADIQLGDLVRLNKSYANPQDGGGDEGLQVYYNQGYRPMFGQHVNGQEQSSEAIGVSPGTLKYRVGITATFAVKSSTAAK